MPRCLTVAPHLATEAVERRYRACRDPVERSHWHSGIACRKWPP